MTKHLTSAYLIIAWLACTTTVSADVLEAEAEIAAAAAVDLYVGCAWSSSVDYEACPLTTETVVIGGGSHGNAGISFMYSAFEPCAYPNGFVNATGHVRCQNWETGEFYDESFELSTALGGCEYGDTTRFKNIVECAIGYEPVSMPTRLRYGNH